MTRHNAVPIPVRQRPVYLRVETVDGLIDAVRVWLVYLPLSLTQDNSDNLRDEMVPRQMQRQCSVNDAARGKRRRLCTCNCNNSILTR